MDLLKGAYNAAVQKVDGLQGTDIQKKVKEATSNENWGTSGGLKMEIAQASNDHQLFVEIMDVLWKKINEKSENWRIIFKSLDLLMFLVKNGHQRIIDDVRDHQVILNPLNNFIYYEPDTGVDRGRGIRELAKQIIDLVNDRKRLLQVREEAQKQANKLSSINSTAISSEGGRYGGYNSNYSSNQYKSRPYDDSSTYNEKPISSFTSNDKKKKNKKKSENEDGEDSDDASAKKKKKSSKKQKKKESSEDEQDNNNDDNDNDNNNNNNNNDNNNDDDNDDDNDGDDDNDDNDSDSSKKKKIK